MTSEKCIAISGSDGAVGRALQKALALESIPFRTLGASKLPAEYSRIGEHIDGDETDPAKVKELMKGATSLVHLGRVGVTPDEDFCQEELAGMATLLPAVCDRGIEIHFVSSSEVFSPPADPSKEKVDEETPIEPSSSLGVAKQAWEQTLKIWARQKGLRYVLYRVPFVVAEYLSYTSRSARYLRAGFRKGVITPKPQPGDRWGISYVHAEDVAKTIARSVGLEKAYGEAYHLSADQWLPESELAEMSYRVLHDFMIPCKWFPPNDEAPSGLVNSVWLDNRKAVEALGLDVSNSGVRIMQKLRIWVDDFGSTAHLPSPK